MRPAETEAVVGEVGVVVVMGKVERAAEWTTLE
jgi:hypothetical protein